MLAHLYLVPLSLFLESPFAIMDRLTTFGRAIEFLRRFRGVTVVFEYRSSIMRQRCAEAGLPWVHDMARNVAHYCGELWGLAPSRGAMSEAAWREFELRRMRVLRGGDVPALVALLESEAYGAVRAAADAYIRELWPNHHRFRASLAAANLAASIEENRVAKAEAAQRAWLAARLARQLAWSLK